MNLQEWCNKLTASSSASWCKFILFSWCTYNPKVPLLGNGRFGALFDSSNSDRNAFPFPGSKNSIDVYLNTNSFWSCVDKNDASCVKADPDGEALACCSVVALGGISFSLHQQFKNQTLTFSASQYLANGTVIASLSTNQVISAWNDFFWNMFIAGVNIYIECCNGYSITISYFWRLLGCQRLVDLFVLSKFFIFSFILILAFFISGSDPLQIFLSVSLWVQGRNFANGLQIWSYEVICSTILGGDNHASPAPFFAGCYSNKALKLQNCSGGDVLVASRQAATSPNSRLMQVLASLATVISPSSTVNSLYVSSPVSPLGRAPAVVTAELKLTHGVYI